jgi:hypothetical protein
MVLFTVTDQIDAPAGTVEPYIWKKKRIKLVHFWLVVSSENAQTTMEEPRLGFQIG